MHCAPVAAAFAECSGTFLVTFLLRCVVQPFVVSTRVPVEVRLTIQKALLNLGIRAPSHPGSPMEADDAPSSLQSLKDAVLTALDVEGFALPLEHKLLEVLDVLASCAGIVLAERDEDARSLDSSFPNPPASC
jgi:hypothetical protein